MATADHVSGGAAPPVPATFRRLRPGDEPDERAVLDLLERSFRRWPPWDTPGGELGFLRWFAEGYVDREGQSRGLVGIVERDSRVIAVSVSCRQRAKVGDSFREGMMGAYGAVDPDVRRQGVSKALSAWYYAQPGLELSWGYTQVEALVRNRRARGTLPVANPLSVFVLMLDPLGAAADLRVGSARHVPGYVGLALRSKLARRAAPRNPGWTVRRVESFDERADAFGQQAAQPFAFIAERSRAYLNWRYCDPRGGEFTALVAEQDGELLGYTALRQIRTRGHIAELLALPGRVDVARSLIDEGVRRLHGSGAHAVECTMMLHHPYAAQLRRAGFVRLRDRSTTLSRKLGITASAMDERELAFLSDPHAPIHIVQGDSHLI